MDLIALVLRLKPLPSPRPAGSQPAWWGRAAHALLLELIGRADGGLAAALHDEQGPRPYTVSSLLGRFPQGRLDPAGDYRLRLTGLSGPVSAILARAAEPDGPLAPGATLELDYQPFRVEAAVAADAPWTGRAGYVDLAAGLLAGEIPRRLSLQFTSPTTFKSQGKHVPIPQPELVFGSLLGRWNAFAPLAFPEEARRYAQECLAVTRYHLRTRSVPVKGGGLRMGAVGQMTYTTLNYDRYWMGVVQALAEFALFSGVGAGTTMGLGQARRV